MEDTVTDLGCPQKEGKQGSDAPQRQVIKSSAQEKNDDCGDADNKNIGDQTGAGRRGRTRSHRLVDEFNVPLSVPTAILETSW